MANAMNLALAADPFATAQAYDGSADLATTIPVTRRFPNGALMRIPT